MPTITDWLMVGITAVYVIATIMICLANVASAKATKKQIEESERQYEETKRLNCLPFLHLEFSQSKFNTYEVLLPLCKEKPTQTRYSILALRNVGNGAAVNITYSWYCDSFSISEHDYLPFNAIGAGNGYIISFNFPMGAGMVSDFSARLEFMYNDLLGNSYEQKAILVFKDFTLVECNNDIPQYLGCADF